MRKSTFYLAISIEFLLLLFIICFILKLPNNFTCNLIRIMYIIFGILFYMIYSYLKNVEHIRNSILHIEDLKKEYKYINDIVLVHSHLMFPELSSNFVEKYKINIDSCDSYLLDFESNIEYFKNLNSEKKIKNVFISVACVMDSLVSGWKIKTDIPENAISDDDLDSLIKKNCQLAIAVALSLLNLSYEDLKDNSYISMLIELLIICYLDEACGNTLVIENEALILELLYNDFLRNN